MELWLQQSEIKYRLPILPAEYEISNESNNTQVNIHSLGEINLIGKRKLRNISFSSFFPHQPYYTCQYTTFPSPKESVALIQTMQSNGVLRLIMTGVLDTECTIESFTWSENDGTKDINFSLDLKEYRHPQITKPKETVPKKITAPATKRSNKEVKTTRYVVKKGDTLSKIAKMLTGNSANWRLIWEQNKNIIDDPNLIYPKQELTIKVEN